MVLLLAYDLVDVVDWAWMTVTLHVIHSLIIMRLVVRLLSHNVLFLDYSHHGGRGILEPLRIDKVWGDHAAITAW